MSLCTLYNKNIYWTCVLFINHVFPFGLSDVNEVNKENLEILDTVN